MYSYLVLTVAHRVTTVPATLPTHLDPKVIAFLCAQASIILVVPQRVDNIDKITDLHQPPPTTTWVCGLHGPIDRTPYPGIARIICSSLGSTILVFKRSPMYPLAHLPQAAIYNTQPATA